MTPAVTHRVFRSSGGVEKVDPPIADNAYESARPPTRARARLTVTHRIDRWVDITRSAAGSWWLLTTRPLSMRAAWKASRLVDPHRVPLRSRPLQLAWRWSNRTDRILLFALALLAPSCLMGPLLWVAARPSRRLGFWLVVLALALGLTAAGHQR
jgi:hypothetical protein